MFALASLVSVALAAVSAVSGFAVPIRRDAPASYDQNALEPYDQYHARYLALDCEAKHDTAFFGTCCSPMTTSQTLSERPAECNPWTSSSTAAPALAAVATASSSEITGGVATYFYQNGVAGACGVVHKDSDFVAAIDQDRYGNSGDVSALCGKQVQITNEANGHTVKVTIADDCPTCLNSNSIDLSVAAFKTLADLSVGEVKITWNFL